MNWSGTGGARLDALLADPRLPTSAVAFDADGTLWHGDIGEEVLRYLAVAGHAPADAVEQYLALTDSDMVDACAYCLRAIAGVSLRELDLATAAVLGGPPAWRLIEPAIDLAKALLARRAEVWIISGSNLWSVREAAARAGLGGAGVLAVSGDIVGGRITGGVHVPIPCRAGKVAALRLATRRPLLFAAGNSDYDLDLLEHAELRLAVGPRQRSTFLLAEAERRGWLMLRV